MANPASYCLFETSTTWDLYPFTLTRPVFALRCGILTQHARWESVLGQTVGTLANGHLHKVFSSHQPTLATIWINGAVFPDEELVSQLTELPPQRYLIDPHGTLLAAHTTNPIETPVDPISVETLEGWGLQASNTDFEATGIFQLEHIFRHNRRQILFDFELIRQTQTSAPIPDQHSIVYGKDNVFVSEGVSVKAAILNAEDGPIYLGPHSTVMEGAVIRNAHAICEHATVNVGAKLRGDTTVGSWSKVGGEIGNSVIMGFSNKGHDGYLGNSVLGYWCNLGADSNTSNLKNNYAPVRIWHYPTGRFRATGQQFCGLMMGDHSKCGINTMFNTGTVVGVSANIFGGGFPRNFIPSFAWGGSSGFSTYRFSKAIETAQIVMARRKKELSDSEEALLQAVFDTTAQYRIWEKK